ncbi:CPBP family intramembrane glutamic endopeptidase [Microbacterium sp. SS28]|uniref:CPBP family intramembrane glutamic endopeptidase n=1 Tax=Microbacterium sp. SS28 TaxID=2919948 RepID=UPI001FA94E69|nr:CPBP family intramembrane glutamic endopeptidase [Microbacterium sp. SS28]
MSDQPTDAPAGATRAQLRAQREADNPFGPLDLVPVPEPALAGDEGAEAVSAGRLWGLEGVGPDREVRATREPRTDWRLGGRTVRRWREWLLAGALVGLGLGVLGGALVRGLWQSPWAWAAALALVWLGMLVPVVWAFTRSRPAGLLRFRALDLLYAVVLGVALRIVQGALAAASGNAAFPSYGLVDGRLSTEWLFAEVLGPLLAAPIVEEFFFRAVIIVALYTVLRRPLGHVVAGVAAGLTSVGLFVLVHGLTLAAPVDAVVSIALLGLVCSLLVLLTGRIWGAVLVHLSFNASYVALALVGAFLG